MLRSLSRKLRGVSHMSSLSPKNMDLEVERIVWIDMEMTGLNVQKDKILEVACLITDADLNILAEGPDIIIHQDEATLNDMHDWSKKQHQKTGLTEASKNSKVNLAKAEEELLGFMKRHVTQKMSPLAGNTVYMDRLFISRYLPRVNDYLHYRLIDVSTIKELCRRWNYPAYQKAPKKDLNHRALSDIRESVKELKYYREAFFKLEN